MSIDISALTAQTYVCAPNQDLKLRRRGGYKLSLRNQKLSLRYQYNSQLQRSRFHLRNRELRSTVGMSAATSPVIRATVNGGIADIRRFLSPVIARTTTLPPSKYDSGQNELTGEPGCLNIRQPSMRRRSSCPQQ